MFERLQTHRPASGEVLGEEPFQPVPGVLGGRGMGTGTGSFHERLQQRWTIALSVHEACPAPGYSLTSWSTSNRSSTLVKGGGHLEPALRTHQRETTTHAEARHTDRSRAVRVR